MASLPPPPPAQGGDRGSRGGQGGGPGRGPRIPAVPTSQAVARLHAEDGDGAGAGAVLLPVAVLQDVLHLPQVLRLVVLRAGGRRPAQLPLGRHAGREASRACPCAPAAPSRSSPLLRARQSPAFPAKRRRGAGRAGRRRRLLPPFLFPFAFLRAAGLSAPGVPQCRRRRRRLLPAWRGGQLRHLPSPGPGSSSAPRPAQPRAAHEA